MKIIKGFTLIEIMIAMAVIAVLLVGGSLVMFATLGSRGQNQADTNINQAGSEAMEAIEQSIRFSTVESVGANNRSACLLAGSTGVSGNSLVVSDSWGSTTYSLNSNRVASISGATRYLSSSNVTATNLSFTWLCVVGSYDKLRVSVDLDDPSVTDRVLKRTFRRDVNMYNSGI